MYNPIMLAGFVGWASAQVLKFILFFFQHSDFKVERLYGSGGMPSSHSALTCAATIAAGRVDGWESSVFAALCVLSVIVMYDAAGVRRAAGMHAKELNQIRLRLFSQETDAESKKKELKELLGHTPLQVFCGAMLGILVGALVPLASA